MPGLDLEPRYFRADGTALFGCYHPPIGEPPRPCGVVLAYPMGQEYIRSHRTYRQLAARLAHAGFPTLRFDFSGSGDSAGDFEEAGIRQWLDDLAGAVAESRRRCGRARIGLVGLRLGGTLALLHGAERGDVDVMVLWDPVIDGRAHLEELAVLSARGERPGGSPLPAEVLGFPLTDRLGEDLAAIDLLGVRGRAARCVLVIDTDEAGGAAPLAERLVRLGTAVDYHRVSGPRIWLKANKTVVPHQVLQGIVAWMSRVSP